MKRVFRSNAEVCHVWASREQDYGEAGNIDFRNGTIYSYGWWPMAKWFTGKNDEPFVIIAGWSYSSSTSQHLSHVRSAIPANIKVFECNEVYESYATYRISPELTPEGALKTMLQSAKELYDDFFNARSYSREYATTPEKRQGYSLGKWQKAKDLCELAGLEWNEDFDVYLISDFEVEQMNRVLKPVRTKIQERIRKREEKNRLISEAHYKALSEYLVSLIDAAKMWMRGEISDRNYVDLPEDNEYRKLSGIERLYQGMETAMRIEGNEVVTNRNARVPLREAKILWERMKSGKPVHGAKVGYYTVTSWNGELVIGCHHIPREIVEYFVEYYGW